MRAIGQARNGQDQRSSSSATLFNDLLSLLPKMWPLDVEAGDLPESPLASRPLLASSSRLPDTFVSVIPSVPDVGMAKVAMVL